VPLTTGIEVSWCQPAQKRIYLWHPYLSNLHASFVSSRTYSGGAAVANKPLITPSVAVVWVGQLRARWGAILTRRRIMGGFQCRLGPGWPRMRPGFGAHLPLQLCYATAR
jgi:hypothetical protein